MLEMLKKIKNSPKKLLTSSLSVLYSHPKLQENLPERGETDEILAYSAQDANFYAGFFHRRSVSIGDPGRTTRFITS